VHTGKRPPADVVSFEEAVAVDVSQPIELPPRGLVCMAADARPVTPDQRPPAVQQPK